MSGSVTRTPTGLRIEPRLMLARDVSLAQPLPAAEAANPPDAARQVMKERFPPNNGYRADVLKGGDYYRIWYNKGGTHYLVHFNI